MKAFAGSLVFLLSLFVMRQILVETGTLTPMVALVFLAATIGIPFGGLLFLESAQERETRETADRIRELEERLARLEVSRGNDASRS